VASKFATIDDYIRSLPEDVQPIIEDVRRTIRRAVPGSTETISYQIPTFTLNGVFLLSLAAWKRHIGIYPLPALDEALEREIALYRAAKSTVRFPFKKPIPHDLIERLVKLRVEQQG
jgi:uncharacterized protein YdhG (YjbR/CyaY superfamily)